MKCLEQIARCKFNLLAVPGYYDQMVEGLVTCPECLQTFKNPGSLIHHMEVHRGETTCRVCGKVQSRVANLRRHLAKVHGVDMQLQPLSAATPGESLPSIEDSGTVFKYSL